MVQSRMDHKIRKGEGIYLEAYRIKGVRQMTETQDVGEGKTNATLQELRGRLQGMARTR